MLKRAVFLLLAFCSVGQSLEQSPFLDPQAPQVTKQTWKEKYGEQFDQPFSGPLSFSHLTYARCLEDESVNFDIALLGMPFDTGVSYRPGARFGPYAIRSGSRRQKEGRGYTMSWANNPYTSGLKIVDCGDVPVSPFDNALAMDQIEVAYSTLLKRELANPEKANPKLSSVDYPRIVSLGGDHTIVLPILRALYQVYGPISGLSLACYSLMVDANNFYPLPHLPILQKVIHLDAHLDTWGGYPGQITEQSRVTHGTFFYLAQEEGLISNNSIHAGIRCKLGGEADLENDQVVGFQLISTDDIDDLGIPEIIKRIRARVGSSPVYLSLDIDVIDPGLAPATGTPEAGGWTTREVKRILRGLAGLKFVGADLVEVAPAYDNAEITAVAAADLVHDFLSMFISEKPPVGQKIGPASRDEL
ncbi:hypothetical protein D9758_002149 [Tetrapyrgos nigripes]|uniref:Agmatinase n=1 Tax=Tetrapyrgos nigripes TaxID=182062 RepID=A0A8H5LT86_9AGAR|nr:hypothetical protein D9758_002149 [Tetrapyrgos nigripes]